MDYQQKLTLSPLQKYELYNQFPWQMILHTLLIVFTTVQVLNVLDQLTAQSRAQHMIFKNILLGLEEDNDEQQFYNFDDFQQQLLTMMDNLNGLEDILFQNVNMSLSEFKFNIFYSQFDTDNANQTVFDVDIDEGFTEPFNINDVHSIKSFIGNVQLMEFQGNKIYNFINFRDIEGVESCTNWNFKITYNFDKIGVINAKIETGNSNCPEDQKKQSGQDFLLIHFIVLILGGISIYTTIKYLYDIGSEYMYNKQMYKDIKNIVETQPLNDQSDLIQQGPQVGVKFSQAWRNVDYQQDVKAFNNWYILNALGGFFQVVGATIAIMDQILTNDLSIYKFQIMMMGFGCFSSWLMLLQYLEYFQDISLVTWTLKKSSKNIAMFIFSILPFFFGFVYLAQAIFWKYNYFQSTIDTILSLFSLSNGDILLESFNLVKPIGIIGQIYLIVFMIVFFTAVQSVLIAIIMEGYDEINAQRKRENNQDQKIKDEILDQIQKEQEEISKSARNDEFDDDKEIIISKLNLFMRRIDRMLEDLDLMADEIENANITINEKEYLLNVLRENIDNISRNVKFQISNMES
ncbi:unnamed protein product (macronuclear) [Paramecium tetraurelia]|uniref:Polycystin cation channel PKD1/PKD2 domain-containing protein n=1 Tax=Paramecium tetraurelia TaxID=5888 RepID=A0DPK6_PARTE|nr:uncharacterized protein GSPATT00019155001 [Paramecium tetraurelia]CAK84973.1 unnamed protein product [Paramecium tetraurelia]|eukprot:XP_001452370.1 hypothetical protein (macronuclear) [Paramecium tetraurelia strain d4-2]